MGIDEARSGLEQITQGRRQVCLREILAWVEFVPGHFWDAHFPMRGFTDGNDWLLRDQHGQRDSAVDIDLVVVEAGLDQILDVAGGLLSSLEVGDLDAVTCVSGVYNDDLFLRLIPLFGKKGTMQIDSVLHTADRHGPLRAHEGVQLQYSSPGLDSWWQVRRHVLREEVGGVLA